MATTTLQQSVASSDTFQPPYAPSWYDRLDDWLGTLPGARWIYYLGFFLFIFAYIQIGLWLNGRLAVGTIDFARGYFALNIVWGLWVLGYFDRLAETNLATFRPVLDVNTAEYERFRFELMTMPARATLVWSLLGAAVGVAAVLLIQPATYELFADSLPTLALEFGWIPVLTFLVGGVAAYHTIRQLRWVSRIQAHAVNVNLFQPSPLYAFSELTSQTAISIMLFVAYNIIAGNQLTMSSGPALAVVLLYALMGVASFILPLWGIRQKLKGEKTRLLSEVNARIEATAAQAHQAVDLQDISRMGELNHAMATLALERDMISKISTYPWELGALTGVLTALVVPIILWLVTRVLERLVP